MFEFHRNDAFDSRPYSFSAAQAALPKPPFKWNQYGYTLGGPIWSNKVFFMSNWEGYRDRKQNQQNYSLPLAAWRTGDFSSYSGPLYDPATCTVASASGVRTCATFPGNRIPANRIHPTSEKLLEFYPEPNATGTDATGTVNNYTGIQNRVIDKDQFTQRFDFVQSSSSTWMGRYSHSRDDEINPALKLNGTKLVNRIHQAMVGNTRTLSPTVVNEFRFGYNSFYNTFGRELAFVRDVTSELGIPGMSPLPETAWGIPSIGINGLSGFGDSTEGPYTNRNKVFEFIDNVSWIKGRHSFKVGAHFRIDHYNQVGNQFPRGGFQFDGRATGSLNGTVATDRALVCRLPARLPASLRVVGPAGGDGIPRGQPELLLHRHLENARQHDARSRPAVRVRPAVRGQSRHVDQCLHAVLRPGPARGRQVAASNPGAHRRRGVLRGFQHPLQPGDPDGT